MDVKNTNLYAQHRALSAVFVEFANWQMPLHYGSQIAEHLAVRKESGVFDVSHMGIVDIQGLGARAFLRRLLANDVGRIDSVGKACYSCLLNEDGRVLDDLIVYHLSENTYRLVVNAATTVSDLQWIKTRAVSDLLEITHRTDLSLIAIQGPASRLRVQTILTPEQLDAALGLAPFCAESIGDWLIARTGYTGEDGLEIMAPHRDIQVLWDHLIKLGVQPCGLGARDTLRLEAGMCLYGQDMDETVSPLSCGLGWTVAWEPLERNFIGRKALESEKEHGPPFQQYGLMLEARGVLRAGLPVYSGHDRIGLLTSGTFSPTLNTGIGIARLRTDHWATGQHSFTVEIRGKKHPVSLVKLPFVRYGHPKFKLLNPIS